MIRVLGAPGDPTSHMENQLGEPAANPYLYMMSQIIAGLDEIDRNLDPGPQEDDPYSANRPLLPKSLLEALDCLDRSSLFRSSVGDVFVDYFLKLKKSGSGRFLRHLRRKSVEPGEEVTAWERDGNFDFF